MQCLFPQKCFRCCATLWGWILWNWTAITSSTGRPKDVIRSSNPSPCCWSRRGWARRTGSSSACMIGCRMAMTSAMKVGGVFFRGEARQIAPAACNQAGPQTGGPVSIYLHRDGGGRALSGGAGSAGERRTGGFGSFPEHAQAVQGENSPYENTSLLVQANAERLPFADRTFDVVFHVGGINFFDQPAVAVREMVRVARAGALILIADETKVVVEKNYQRSPFTRAYFKDAPTDFSPRDWVRRVSAIPSMKRFGRAKVIS